MNVVILLLRSKIFTLVIKRARKRIKLNRYTPRELIGTSIKMVSLKKILSLQPGDIIPLDMPKNIIAKAEGVPMFNATFGEHKGKAALKVVDKIKHPNDTTPQFILQKKKTTQSN